jgi:hypothetical protein
MRMTHGTTRRQCAAIALGLMVALPSAAFADDVRAAKPAASAAAIAEYHRLLEAYRQAHDPYVAAASAYWSSIADKRRLRRAKRAAHEPIGLDDYVLTQPPVYSGPPKPIDPSAPPVQPPTASPVPVVADFLRAAHDEYNFTPRQPKDDITFKRAYAAVAAAAGLTKDQVVRIYSFEATGNGTYDLQAGLEYKKPGARAITTALGYNQLLATNSVELMAESGDAFVKGLHSKADRLSGTRKVALQYTIAIVQQMISYARSVPDDWSQHDALASTPKGLAIHAMNLDLDIGPLLQTQKLLDSVVFARRQGHGAALTAAELEMMNLTGDGNGFDMITMPQDLRIQVPTANFFQRTGYADNPVAQRNNLVATLIAATNATMEEESKKQGAKDLAAAFPIGAE